MFPERKEATNKEGVIFAIVNNNKLQLEKRINPTDKYFGYSLIPGGKIEQGETHVTALCREVIEEYGVLPMKFKKVGEITSEDNGSLNRKHVYLVTKWLGVLSNPENKNSHFEVSINDARGICRHPVSQLALDLLEKELFRQNSQRV